MKSLAEAFSGRRSASINDKLLEKVRERHWSFALTLPHGHGSVTRDRMLAIGGAYLRMMAGSGRKRGLAGSGGRVVPGFHRLSRRRAPD